MALYRLDTWAAVHPAWRPRLAELCDRTGCRLGSVWRSSKLQAHWRKCWEQGCKDLANCHGVPGDCPGANLPGRSFHETAEALGATSVTQIQSSDLAVADQPAGGSVVVPCSLAVDLDWDGDAIWRAHELAPGLGLHFPIWDYRQDEEWHVQPIEVLEFESPHPGWSPYESVARWVKAPPDPWRDLFVPLLVND